MNDPLLTITKPELLNEGSDRQFRTMLYAYFAFGRTLEATRGKFASFVDLTSTQYLILIAIAHAKQESQLGINQLAEQLYLSGAFVTIEVNKLVTDGLVEKSVNPLDRRRVQLSATPAGIDRLRRLAAYQRPVNDALFESLTRDEFDILSELLNRLAARGNQAIKLAEHIEAMHRIEEADLQL